MEGTGANQDCTSRSLKFVFRMELENENPVVSDRAFAMLYSKRRREESECSLKGCRSMRSSPKGPLGDAYVAFCQRLWTIIDCRLMAKVINVCQCFFFSTFALTNHLCRNTAKVGRETSGMVECLVTSKHVLRKVECEGKFGN